MWVIIAPPIHLGAWSMAVAAFCIIVFVCTGYKMPQLCVKLKASITRLTKIVAKLERTWVLPTTYILPADLYAYAS